MKGRLVLLVLFVVLVAGAVLRYHGLAERTMGHIELYTPNIMLPQDISVPPPRLTPWTTLTGSMWEVHPPAWYVSMWFYTKAFGSELWAIRFPSVLFGLFGILLIYALGQIEGDRFTGLLAASLLAFNGHHVLWSQVARPYMAASSIGLLATVLLLLATRNRKQRGLLQWLYAGVMLYGLATVHYFWLLLGTHILWTFLSAHSKEGFMIGWLRTQLGIFISASPLIALVVFQSRSSYLEDEVIGYLLSFVQFGFLFDLDTLVEPSSPPGFLTLSLITGVVLLALGIFGRDSSEKEDVDTDIRGPSLKQLGVLTILALGGILVAAAFFHGYRPDRTPSVLASTVVPLAALGAAVILERNTERFALWRARRLKATISLTTYLALVPALIVAGLSLVAPLFATRHMLVFTPYLLLVLSRGVIQIARVVAIRRLVAVPLLVLLGFLVAVHYSSIVFCKQRPFEPRNYKALASRWEPNISASDLIMLQRHWSISPIFYYLNEERYQFVGSDYAEATTGSPESRFWLLTCEGVPPTAEMRMALDDYLMTREISARGISARLYVPPHQASTIGQMQE